MSKLLLFFLVFPYWLIAQSSTDLALNVPQHNLFMASAYANNQSNEDSTIKKYFVDGSVGALVVLSDFGEFATQIHFGGGYLVSKNIGLGAELKGFKYSGTSSGNGMVGLGGFARFQVKRFFLKQSYGRVLYGSSSSEYEPNVRFDYIPSGQYYSTSLVYRFNAGIELGFNYSFVNKVRFENYTTDDLFQDSGQPLKYRGELKDEFGGLTVIVGFTLPK